MAKNANFVSHKKSKLKNQDGSPQLPLASALVEGEIAINFAENVETLSIKNESGDVVTFSSDNYYTEKKLGSGFTGANSAVTVTEALENVEIDVDQVIDSGTSASTNAVSTKAVYEAVTDNELVWTNAYVTLSGAVSAHTANTEIHVTAADKTAWNAKVDASAIADFFDDAKYEDSGTTKVINFYHGNTIKATIDASDFIVDGMVDDVRIENGNLVIDFNTASGKQDISIPLTDIFDPSNYYNKTAIDNLVGSGFTSSSITDVIIENEEIVSAALTDLDNKKLDASAYTPTDLSNYYTKSETSGATEIGNALGGKVNSATYTGHTADTTVHFTTGTVQTQIDNSISGKVNTSDIISAITPSNSGSTAPIATKVVAENELTVSNALTDLERRKLDASAYTPTDLSNYYQKSETSGKTEISTALNGKSDTDHTHSQYLTGITSSQVTTALGFTPTNNTAFTAHTADTTVHVTSSEKSTWNGKANASTTLAGYGITNAYTKTEIDNMIGNIETLLAAI